MTTTQAPSLGRIVHYQSRGVADGVLVSEPLAAIVSQLPATGHGIVGLTVFHPIGVSFVGGVPYAATPTPGHWSWPPRV